PIWVGTLISGYGLSEPMAGGLVSLFLIAVVAASIILAPIFHKLNGRALAPLGFWISAGAFYAMTLNDAVVYLAALHAVAGFGTGIAISFVHGTMGKTTNPHRTFAIGSLALGVGMAVFLGVTPGFIENTQPSSVFIALGSVMGLAALVGTLAFPSAKQEEHSLEMPRFSRAVWCAIVGIMCMALVQAMIFSFVERIGSDMGIPTAQLALIFVGVGLMNIIPPILAGLLETRLTPLKVAVTGGFVQAVLVLTLTNASILPLYVLPMVLMPFTILFTHIFVFGFLARNEPSGRAVAATPAMIMTGSATAPFIGGVLVHLGGYTLLGFVGAAFSLIAFLAFIMARREAPANVASAA
ncbi:MAG: MFS transporter, partial [Pseudomonadota bacterium]